MTQLVGIAISLGIAALMLLILFIKANLVICQPNEVIIISGRRRRLKDGTVVGHRVIKGGRGFKLPIIEKVSRMPLTAIPIEIRLPKALSKGVIPINVEGRANIKIAGSEQEGLDSAIERFLGKNLREVALVAKETIEGSLRGVIASVTPEEANSSRMQLAAQVAEQGRSDLRRLGLVLDFIKIQSISDDQGYLEAIGRQKNAEVLKNARIAEATAEAEARMVSAEQRRKSKVAEAEAELVVIEHDNKVKVHRANLQALSNQAAQRAEISGEIARVEEEQKLQEGRVELNRRRHEADVVVPARAEKTAAELRASGEAARILENGKATAEAVHRMQQQWQDGNTRDLFVIQMLPELVDKVTRVVAENLNIERLTVIDSGEGNGLPSHVKNLTTSATVILEQLKNSLGLDIPSLLRQGRSNGSGGAAALPKIPY